MTDETQKILDQRGPVYGPFANNALVAQGLKAAMQPSYPEGLPARRYDTMPVDCREALDLIALKMSRIVTGDPEYLDNWLDISGYATLVANRLRKMTPQPKSKPEVADDPYEAYLRKMGWVPSTDVPPLWTHPDMKIMVVGLAKEAYDSLKLKGYI